MLPIVFGCVVGIVMAAYVISALGHVGEYRDPHDWSDDDE